MCSQRSEPRLTFALQISNEGVKPELSYLFSVLGLTASLVSLCDVLHSALRFRLTFAAQIGNDAGFRPGELSITLRQTTNCSVTGCLQHHFSDSEPGRGFPTRQ